MEFVKKAKEKVMWKIEGNINNVWNMMATCVKDTAKEIFGVSRSSMPENKETW